MGRTIFVGDIHGCAEEFDALLKALSFTKDDRLLLAGDAFTKGPDPLGVWDLIQFTEAEMVLGNHDVALLQKLHNRLEGREKKLKKDHRKILDDLMPGVDTLVPWLKALPLFIEEPDFLLVHAGINPEKELVGTSRDEFIAIRTWPKVKGIDGPRWHDVYEPARPLIVFGHDAPGGLVVKRNELDTPYLIGLDSGCVYGKHLSAYVLEEKQIVQVKSKQPDVFKNLTSE